MVTVPVYGGQQVRERAAFQQGVNVQANASAFGADVGQGMQQLGRGLGQAAEVMGQLQAFDDTQRAKDADTKLANWARERMYGEGGFMTMEGRNAVDGRAKFEAEVEEKRKEFGKGLTGGAGRAYANASQSRIQSIYQSSIVHTANARKQWFNETANAQITSFANDALAGYQNPETVNKNIAAGQLLIRDQAAMAGWSPEKKDLAEKEFISSTRMNVALRMLADDPVKADKYYKEHKDQISGPHQFKFEESLKVPLTQAHVLTHTQNFFSGGGSDYYAAIRSAESSGNDAAKNPNSSATGRYQFIESTWRGLMRTRPDLGLTLGGRLDPAQQERAIRAFTEDNAKKLIQGGVQVTNGTLYAAHFLGVGGALNVLRADPGASVASIVGEGVVKANGFLRNMSVGQFAAWAERKGGGSAGAAPASSPAGGGAPSYSTIEPFLATIKDPTEREMTRKAIYGQLDGQRKAQEAQQEAYKAQAFNLIETQNINPFSLPPEVKAGIGMSGMSSLMDYWDKRSKGDAIQTDAVTWHELQVMAANDPQGFAKINLFDYKNVLSKEDWKTAEGMKMDALKDDRKAREDGIQITSAMSQASQMLDSVGLSTTGMSSYDRSGAKGQEVERQRAQFMNTLTMELDAAKRANGGVNPNQAQTQQMINRLLLPMVMKQEGAGWFGGTVETEGRMFQMPGIGQVAPGTTVEMNYKLKDIPPAELAVIQQSLQESLQRKPSEEEIVAFYERYQAQTFGLSDAPAPAAPSSGWANPDASTATEWPSVGG